MAAEKAPAFQFYPKDFLTDSHVVAMTLQEVGAYMRLLCLCWLNGSIPADPSEQARLFHLAPSAWKRIWPRLSPCFSLRDGRLIQPRLERERNKQATFRAMKSAAGQKGGITTAEGKQKAAVLKQTRSRRYSSSQAKSSPPSSSSSSSSISDLLPSVKRLSSADADFHIFLNAYPVSRRVGGKVGRTAFEKAAIGRHGDSLATVLLALEQQKRSEQWHTPKLIPLMTTWLNQARWLQVLPEVGTPTAIRTADVLTYAEQQDAAYRRQLTSDEKGARS